MLNNTPPRPYARIFKILFIVAFVCASASIFIYGNFLMINRPYAPVASLGYVYPFLGKGGAIYISKIDYAIIIGSVIALIASMIAANRFARIEAGR